MGIFPETYNDPIFLLIVDFVKASLYFFGGGVFGGGGGWLWLGLGLEWGGWGE